jgi:hypothetical protein
MSIFKKIGLKIEAWFHKIVFKNGLERWKLLMLFGIAFFIGLVVGLL